MNILAIESSTPMLSVAITAQDTLLHECVFDTAAHHSDRLLRCIHACLHAVSLTLPDIDVFAVSQGPGSLTGVRVGMSCLKGLCMALNKPGIAVSSLDIWARGAEETATNVAVLLCARRHAFYTAYYQRTQPDMICEHGPGVGPLESFLETWPASQKVTITGDAPQSCHEQFVQHVSQEWTYASNVNTHPTARHLALLALKKIEFSKDTDYNALHPLYLWETEAEINWKKQHNTTT